MDAASLKQELLKKITVRPLARCLTGREQDLRKLLSLERIPYPSPVLRAFLRRLSKDLQEGGGFFSNLLMRIGRLGNPQSKRKFIENLVFHWGVKGAGIRTRIRHQGQWVPFIVTFSPTMRCNLGCTGCYSGLYSKDGELSEAELDRLLEECKRMGDYFVVLTGGEPYLLKESLWRLFAKHQDMFFLTYTNGTLIDDEAADTLARLGNVVPAISLEGFEEETDQRRGSGVFKKVMQTMERLHKRGVLFGASITYTSRNVNTVTEERFAEFLLECGTLFAWYFMFVPVGKDPRLDLVPTPEQRIFCGRRISALRKNYPLFMADFWNDGPAVGGCLAGARRYLHVLNSGRVEACVFAHFGVDNIRQKSLLEAANSPFFQAIRQRFPYNESANLRRPCIIVDNPQVLRDLVQEYMVPYGHPHSEDLIKDPTVVKWIDAYALRMKELTEPEWLETIANPQSRWYREKDEYKNLFTFGKMGCTCSPGRIKSSC
jgi:MoaA/NifB/PqqE/SkfB family radical SAM enzyme